ncbi:MAG: diacylglycerol kinase family lipid kinase [Chloroflexi bacterium]|nr:diacylglycerol kinase family lipid kinase [Chloroflexota bacterium]
MNPNADFGRAWHAARDLRSIVDEFGGADWSGTVYPTHATELAYQAAEEGYELIISLGGDGTLHEVINGLMQVPPEKRPRVGVVPLGSGNDFAHSMGIDKRSVVAMRQVFTGKPQPVDVMRICDDSGRCEYVHNTLGIGFDAIVLIRSRQVPIGRGFFSYLVGVFQTILLNHTPMRMEVQTDQEQWSRELLMFTVCNGRREGGGFMLAPDARLDDGLVDYVGVEEVTKLQMVQLLPKFLNGKHIGLKPVHTGCFSSLKLQSNRPLVVHTDGEIFAGFGMEKYSLTIDVIPKAIEVII